MPFTTEEVETDVRQPITPQDPRVLIADAHADVIEGMRLLLEGERLHLETASSPAGVLAAIRANEFDVVLVDLRFTHDTPAKDGPDLLARIRAIDPTLSVVLMSSWDSTDLAKEALRRGAWDFVEKPWEDARLLAIVRTQIALSRALRKGRRLEAENLRLRGLEEMSLEEVERFLIGKAMTRSEGNVSQSAKALGLSRSALYRRLQRYHL